MHYKFENRVISKILKKLVILATNLLIYYFIVKVGYNNQLLIIKLIVLDIEFEVFGKISFANNNLTKLEKVRKSN